MKFHRNIVLISFCAFIAACSNEPGTTTTAAQATTTTVYHLEIVYAAEWGSDTNTGFLSGSPLQSLGKALSLAVASNASYLLVGGDYDFASSTEFAGWAISNVTGLTISGGWDEGFGTQGVPGVLRVQDANYDTSYS
jgi:hypothetical protein